MSQRGGGSWREPSDRRGGRNGERRDHDFDRPSVRGRDAERHRRGDRDGERDRRYRSRSRDRRDRDRDRQHDDRDRGSDRRRDNGLDRDRRRDDDRRRWDEDEARPPRRRNDVAGDHARPRDRDRRRSASPGRPGTASPSRRSDSHHAETLPTRSKGGEQPGRKEQSTMSFKVGDKRGAERAPQAAEEAADRNKPRAGDEDEEDPEAEEEEEVDDEMAAMQAMMGFGGFGSTKGQKIAGNNVGGVRKEKKSEYRQYMNRQGGFNRPLSPSR